MAFRAFSKLRGFIGGRGGLPPFRIRSVSGDTTQTLADDIVEMLVTSNFTMADHTKAQKPITIRCITGVITFVGTTEIPSIAAGESATFYPRPAGWFTIW